MVKDESADSVREGSWKRWSMRSVLNNEVRRLIRGLHDPCCKIQQDTRRPGPVTPVINAFLTMMHFIPFLFALLT